MADTRILVDQDQFNCSLCLDLLKDPATLPCGHSFCLVCINGYWDQRNVYSCPQCRQTFTPRPVLYRTSMLAKMVEKKQTSPEVSEKKLQEKICSEHNKPIEIYCRTDQTCICSLCKMENHKGHDTVTAAAERAEKQNDLKEDQMKAQQRIQEKQKEVEELKQTVDTIKLSAQTAVEDMEMCFTETISFMRKKCLKATELIRVQEETEVSRAEQLVEQLEQEIADLQRRVMELEEVSHTHDHIHFLQTLSSGRRSPPVETPEFHTSSVIVPEPLSFDEIRNSISDLKMKFKEFCEDELNKIFPHVAAVNIISPTEPHSREEFLKYFCYLTLDPNTIQHQLIMSEDNRAVKHSKRKEPYPDHPERFDYFPQVLSKESMCERCYWEAEWSGSGVYISISYKDICRKGQGNECGFGFNDQSWSLWCSSVSFEFYHKSMSTELNVPASSRIGVYVDHSAGILSLYSVSDDTMKLLHRIHTTFTHPLYAGIWIDWYHGSAVKLCDPE